ncbi:MAG: signal transduction histidine kinase/ligand-binding sensor domain-containing protein [Cryomorphaceae bacterium]|jgi:signal transduction histidine kinase/ligand-binding sensor domain-containing protein/CheY-like chemotaxis protein/AraC-like DNA-binding protein
MNLPISFKALPLLFFFFFVFNSLKAQSEERLFHHSSRGAPQNAVSAIVKDTFGFIWLGSRYGLERYDGLEFDEIDDNGNKLGSLGVVNDLLADKTGDIWVGTNGRGVFKFDYKTNDLKRIETKGPNCTMEAIWINTLFEDEEHRVWIGTTTGLYTYDPIDSCFNHYSHDPKDVSSLSSNNVRSIGADADGQIWVGTWDKGLNLLNEKTKHFTRFHKDNVEGLSRNTIRCFELLPSGRFMVGTDEGVREIKRIQGEYQFTNPISEIQIFEKSLRDLRILSMEGDKEGSLWLGTENNGLFLLNLQDSQVSQFVNDANDETSLCSNSIWSLFMDDEGILWLGTFHKGLCKLDPHEKKFPPPFRSNSNLHTLNSNFISSFAEDDAGGTWIGTEGGGLNYLDPESDLITHYTNDPTDPSSLSNNYVIDVLVDSKGRLWSGNWNGGLNLLRKGSANFEHFTFHSDSSNGPANNDIIALCEDQKGRIWLSCFGMGLDCLDPESLSFTHYSSMEKEDHYIPTKLARSILEDSQGRIWLGSDSDGLICFSLDEEGKITELDSYETTNSNIPSNFITDLIEDDRGRLWVGTEGAGLAEWSAEEGLKRLISANDGLAGNFIYAMEWVDSTLWISTNNGLSSFQPESGNIINFGIADGLQSARFNLSASLHTNKGMLFFGGISGFNRFDPTSIKSNPNKPAVYISGFNLIEKDEGPLLLRNGESNILLQTKLKLEHNENDFKFEASALNFSESQKNQYAFRLTNYDQSWRFTSNPREIYYTNVPAGSYTFEVKASNNDGLWSPDVASIDVIISPPWYLTNWAYFLYSMLVITFLVWARRSIIKNEQLKSELILEHLQLDQIRKLSQVRLKFFTDISHEFRTPLTLIISPLQSIMKEPLNEKIKEQLELMLKNSKRLINMINQIMDLSKIESGILQLSVQEHDLVEFVKGVGLSFSGYADRSYVDLKMDLPEKPIDAYFDRLKMEQVIINLLSNAIKFTPRFGKVTLSVQVKKDNFHITIKDSGKGIPEKDQQFIFERFYQVQEGDQRGGTGIGLALAKEIVELHQGQIFVTSKDDKGSKFEVVLLAGSSHFEKKSLQATRHPAVPLSASFDEALLKDSAKNVVPMDVANSDKPLILIAEDHDEIRNYLSDLLKENYQLLECTNGIEAFENARESIPDLIVSDVIMPGMDGYTLIEKLKEDQRTSHIPVIILTSKATPESESKSLELGATQHVTKPFDPSLLMMRIQNTLRSMRTYKQHLLHEVTLDAEPKIVRSKSLEARFIEQALEIIDANMSNTDFQVKDLSDALNMSKAQLYRKMKGVTGTSTNEFIRTYRLKKAAQILRLGSLSISETTYQVGFTDLQYFRKCFVKQYGVTPSEYAENQSKSKKIN